MALPILCSFLKNGSKQADLGFMRSGQIGVCEVKSIGISDNEIERRSSHDCIDGSVYFELSPEFIKKLESTINVAKSQIAANPDLNLIFVIIEFDDFTHDYIHNYRAQLEQFVSVYPTPNLILQIGRGGIIVAA